MHMQLGAFGASVVIQPHSKRSKHLMPAVSVPDPGGHRADYLGIAGVHASPVWIMHMMSAPACFSHTTASCHLQRGGPPH